MASKRRRRTSKGNITKTRTRSKQTLLRVQNRKQSYQLKQQALSTTPPTPSTQPTAPTLPPLPTEQEQPSKARYTLKKTSAYPTLLTNLSHPLFPTTSPSPPPLTNHPPTPTPASPARPASRPALLTRAEPDAEVVQLQNAAAARRDRLHFGLESAPKGENGKLREVGTVAGVGVVSTNVKEECQGRLKADLGRVEEEEVNVLGLPKGMYGRWREEMGGLCGVARMAAIVVREFWDLVMLRRLGVEEEREIRGVYVGHVLGHLLRARGRVGRGDGGRDQGFVRGRVLVVVGMRNVAYEVLGMVGRIVGGDVGNRERFEREFGPGEGEEEKGVERVFRGNVDDDFKIGVSVSSKGIGLYADFYKSDLIVASALGLRRMQAEKAGGGEGRGRGEEEEDGEWSGGIGSERRKKRRESEEDMGFLSSIEVMVVDGAETLSMQNWKNVVEVFGMVNRTPKTTGKTDFSRVRMWCLDGEMGRFRQTVFLGGYQEARFAALVRGFGNWAGRVEIVGKMDGVLVEGVRQEFVKVVGDGAGECGDRRMEKFFGDVLPRVREEGWRAIVVVPSYLEYVRVRNRLVREGEGFASLCEYTGRKDVSRGRARFFDGSVRVLVLTERFYFYRRYFIRGGDTVVWYRLPENCEFYGEIVGMVERREQGEGSRVIVLYDRWDRLRLKRVVGEARVGRMVTGEATTYMFV